MSIALLSIHLYLYPSRILPHASVQAEDADHVAEADGLGLGPRPLCRLRHLSAHPLLPLRLREGEPRQYYTTPRSSPRGGLREGRGAKCAHLALLSATLARGAHRELISGSSGVLGDQRPVASLFLEVVRVSFLLEDDRSIDRVRAPEHHDHLA